MIVIATGFILTSLTAVRCFDNGYVGKQLLEKGEIAHYEQFLHFIRRFQKTCTADMAV